MTRRIVVEAGLVWVEEHRLAQRLIIAAMLLGAVVLGAVLVRVALRMGPSIEIVALLVPIYLYAAWTIGWHGPGLRPHRAFADGAWRRIACADPMQGSFTLPGREPIALHEVRAMLVLQAGFSQAQLVKKWSLALVWPEHSIRICLRYGQLTAWPPLPSPALAAAQTWLQRQGFAA
ncbi:MAG TPA: hypothetical protein VG755_42540 [Nannocystaceae bacterium]|nr:hypothetical protein [Nannocystaceae bacterium]